MKKLLLGILLLTLVIAVYIPGTASAEVNVSIALPPPIVFAAPPEMIVLPETYVYVVPDVEADIFFYNGWWWRPYEGRWYRSQRYDSGWGYYNSVPSFYRGIPSTWRNDYREHRWRGHQWDYQRIPHQNVQKNWRSWEKNRHWEKQKTWGVQGLKTKTQTRVTTRETAKQKTREVNRTKSRDVKPQTRKVSKPQTREAKPQTRKVSKPQTREAKPQSHEAAKPKSGGDKSQHKQQQQEKHEKGR